MKKIFNLIRAITIITSFIFCMYSLTILSLSYIPKLVYIDYINEDKDKLKEYILNKYNSLDYEYLSNNEIKKEVQKIIKPKFYIEQYKNINRSYTKLTIRYIAIQNNLNGYTYAYTLIHEYIHLDKLIANERLTDYLSVIWL